MGLVKLHWGVSIGLSNLWIAILIKLKDCGFGELHWGAIVGVSKFAYYNYGSKF
jgi:hypothetical protein